MDEIGRFKKEIESLIGIHDSDADVFWALSKKCSIFALAPTIAVGAKWGPGMVSMGSLVLPGIGTVSGTTAALLMMGGMWGASYGACMSILPGLIQFRDKLRTDPVSLISVRNEVWHLVTVHSKAYYPP